MCRMYRRCTFWEWRIMYVGDRKGCNESAFSPPPPARGGDSWWILHHSLTGFDDARSTIQKIHFHDHDSSRSYNINRDPSSHIDLQPSSCLHVWNLLGRSAPTCMDRHLSLGFLLLIDHELPMAWLWSEYRLRLLWTCGSEFQVLWCWLSGDSISDSRTSSPTADILIEGVLLFVRGLDDHPHDQKICWHLWIDHIIIKN